MIYAAGWYRVPGATHAWYRKRDNATIKGNPYQPIYTATKASGESATFYTIAAALRWIEGV